MDLEKEKRPEREVGLTISREKEKMASSVFFFEEKAEGKKVGTRVYLSVGRSVDILLFSLFAGNGRCIVRDTERLNPYREHLFRKGRVD